MVRRQMNQRRGAVDLVLAGIPCQGRDRVPPVLWGGALACTERRAGLDAAVKALAEGDLVEMIRAYKALKEWNT